MRESYRLVELSVMNVRESSAYLLKGLAEGLVHVIVGELMKELRADEDEVCIFKAMSVRSRESVSPE